MDDPSAAARPRNLFEKEYYPASTSGARYRWYRLVFHHDAPDERNFDLWLIAAILAMLAGSAAEIWQVRRSGGRA